MIFLVVRTVFAFLGMLMVVQALFGVPRAIADSAWGAAAIALLGGVIGVWLFQVGAKGTFSGRSETRAMEGEGSELPENDR